MKNGPGLDRFGLGFEAWSCQGCFLLVWTALALALKHGPTRGERGSFIGSNPGQEDHQEGVFAQNGVVDRRRDSSRSTFHDEGGMETPDGIFRESTKQE